MSFGYYRVGTIDHTQVPSTQTDFPVALFGTYAWLATVANGGRVQNSNGYDIAIYADSGLTTPLDFELVSYDPTTGAIEIHFREATISSSSDTLFYIAHGDGTISTFQGNVASTWNSHYQLVLHLPNGTTLTANDSTANANHGSISGSPTAAAGVFGGGVHFDGVTGQNINVGTAPATVLSGSFTLSGWVKGTGYQSIWGHRGGNSSRMLWLDSGVNLYAVAENRAIIHGAAVTSGVYFWFVWTYDSVGHASKLYVNGSLGGSASYTFVEDDANDTGLLNDPNQPHSGDYDEFRLLNLANSADWIATEWANQQPSQTFYSVGSEVPVSGGTSVALPLIASAVVLRTPTAAPGGVTEAPPTIASGLVLRTPTLRARVVLATLATAASLFAPAVTVGGVTLTASAIASAAQLRTPTAAMRTSTTAIASVATLAAPTASPGAVTLVAPTRGSTATLYALQLSQGNLIPPAIASAAVLRAPTAAAGAVTLAAPAIASSTAVRVPVLRGRLAPPAIGSAAVLRTPTIGGALQLPAIASGATTAAPRLAMRVAAPTVSAGAVLRAPTVTPRTALSTPTIASGAILRGPAASLRVLLPVILSVNTLLRPLVLRGDQPIPATLTVTDTFAAAPAVTDLVTAAPSVTDCYTEP